MVGWFQPGENGEKYGYKSNFTYNQVTAYRKRYIRNGGEYCVFVENKKVYVNFESVNCSEFMSYVKEKYKMLHNVEELPENNGRWFDIIKFQGSSGTVWIWKRCHKSVSPFIIRENRRCDLQLFKIDDCRSFFIPDKMIWWIWHTAVVFALIW